MIRAELLAQLQSQIDEYSAGPSSRKNEGPAGFSRRSEVRSFSHRATNEDNSADPEPADDESAAFRKIVNLVNASDKSEKAIRERLAASGYGDTAIDAAIDRAIEYGFIDDRRFADVLIRSRIAQGKGSAGIERELKSHNIEPSSLEGWPDAYGIESSLEVERAINFLMRKPPRSKNLREGAYRKLVQRGYSASVASSAARLWLESQSVN